MNKAQLPKISIVTPSLNQGSFLEETIQSVLSQNYPNLEYIIIDGGSTDESIEIIKKYAHSLSYWVSEPDKGRGHALNKGFQHSSGEIMAWLGCGDMYVPWALKVVAEIFSQLKEVEWLTTASHLTWDEQGIPFDCGFRLGYSQKAFTHGAYFPSVTGTLQQESTFWHRSLWDKAGGYIDKDLWIVPDFGLWARFFKFAQVYTVSVPLGGIRFHFSQEKFINTYLSVTKKIWQKHYLKNLKLPSPAFSNLVWLSRVFLTCFKKQKMNIVDYDFSAERWYTSQIKANLFF